MARLGLCVATALAYSNSFQAGFVVDNAFILEDPRLHRLTAHNLGLILHGSYWWNTETGLYRPITSLSYLLNYAVLGNENHAAGYLIINVLLHVANVLLVHALALRLSGRPGPSFFVALLWGVHPILTEAVTNIVGRADLLATLGVLAGLYAYIRGSETRWPAKARWFVASLLAMTVGIFSKEVAVAGIGIIVMYDLPFAGDAAPCAA